MTKLTIGTEAANAFQARIEDELVRRGYTPEKDPTMAEYITIMVINDKTADQINAELLDLLPADYDNSFTEWLFEEAARAANPPLLPVTTSPIPSLADQPTSREEHRRTGGGANLLQSALASAHAPSGSSGTRTTASGAQKRTASARSPSPSGSGPNKSRRTDTPTGPRAMLGGTQQNGKSLLDRVGPHARRERNFNNGSHGGISPAQASHIQAKIDNITGGQVPPFMNGQPPMGMNPNPIGLQEMMMMNWDLMRQMATQLGVMPQNGMPMMPNMPFGQPGMPPPPGAFGPGMPGFSPQQQPPHHGVGRGGGHGRGGHGAGRGRGGAPPSQLPPVQQLQPQPAPVASPAPNAAPAAPTVAVPERPGTPSLCKYVLKCTNPQCRYSHPSPVATPESGMVLSTEFCPQGKDCKDKDCKMGHVSPSVINGNTVIKTQTTHLPSASATSATSSVPCKFGLACTRPGCIFTHPPNFRSPHPSHHHQPTSTVPCRFGTSCTRADCPFQHPKGHVPANMFYRGLGPDAPLVEGYVSPHRSVRFGADGKAAATAATTAAKPTEQKPGEAEKKENQELEPAIGKDKVGEKVVDVGA